MTERPLYQKTKYIKSAMELKQLPADEGFEIAFIGRSNAGKSSALNSITGIKGLARISKTPGRTQAINLFGVNDDCRLVDLPGYGYAKVPRTVKEHWQRNIDSYLQSREALRGLVLVMDIRHPLKELDQHLIEWATHYQVPLHILLTKSDKLKNSQARRTLKKIEERVSEYGDDVTVQLFSAMDRTGVERARQQCDEWFGVDT